MLYKEGDKVVIVGEREGDMNSAGKMDKWLNSIMTIKSAGYYFYRMEEDNEEWAWYDNMIKGKVVDSFKNKYRPGDKIKVKDTIYNLYDSEGFLVYDVSMIGKETLEGNEFIIREVESYERRNGYTLEEKVFWLPEEFIEKKIEETKQDEIKPKFKVGDIVRLKKDLKNLFGIPSSEIERYSNINLVVSQIETTIGGMLLLKDDKGYDIQRGFHESMLEKVEHSFLSDNMRPFKIPDNWYLAEHLFYKKFPQNTLIKKVTKPRITIKKRKKQIYNPNNKLLIKKIIIDKGDTK